LVGCAKAVISATLSNSVIEMVVYFEIADMSGLSFEALDVFLLSLRVKIESEDNLSRLVLSFGQASESLSKHFEIPPESSSVRSSIR
jgi:hypothetical protein